MNSNILLKVGNSGNCLALATYSRDIGRRGRFLIPFDSICNHDWNRPYYDSDCGNFIHIHTDYSDSEKIVMEFTWLNRYGYGALTGHYQYVKVPFKEFMRILHTHEEHSFLCTEAAKPRHIDISHARRTIAEITLDKQKRRALSKIMRTAFQGYDSVTLYNDSWSGGFYFEEEGNHGICGGLILSETTHKTKHGNYPAYKFSIHT